MPLTVGVCHLRYLSLFFEMHVFIFLMKNFTLWKISNIYQSWEKSMNFPYQLQASAHLHMDIYACTAMPHTHTCTHSCWVIIYEVDLRRDVKASQESSKGSVKSQRGGLGLHQRASGVRLLRALVGLTRRGRLMGDLFCDQPPTRSLWEASCLFVF